MSLLQDILEFRFLQFALAASVLASIACGVIGGFIVVRRSTYIAGAVSHSLLAGMGIAFYLNHVHGLTWLTPTHGAVIAAIVVAVIIALVQSSGYERMDTVLSTVWSLGMAIGVTFVAMTPGYNQELMSYLFGNILMVSAGDLILMLILDGFILVMMWMYYHKFLTISFHTEIAELRGVNVRRFELLFLLMTALSIVLLVNVVGIVLVIALLTLPAATAAQFSRRLSRIIVLAAVFTFVYSLGGLVVSYQIDWPTGPTVIQFAAATYLLTMLGKKILSRI